MDTICTITVVETSKGEAEKAMKAAFQEIREYETRLNYFSSDSEISALNRSAGKTSVRISTETLDILEKALKITGYTQGSFDPSVGPLMDLWGFNRINGENPPLPSHADIGDVLKHVSYRSIKVNASESEVFLEKKGMRIDLGGIAKGYAADKAAEVLMNRGIKAALVAIAGDIRGFGLKPDGKPWKVGIQNPRPEGGRSDERGSDIFAALSLRDGAISTSGDYQRFFMKNGKRYHHILDPATGYPSETLISVTVIAPEGFLADGLSTGIFNLGREKGMKLLNSLGLSGVIIDKDREIFITENLKEHLNIEKDL
jgi:thiamine biosynthesis lipoprotein